MNEKTFKEMFDSAAFVRTSRILMMCGTLVGLPVAGWYMTRLVGKADSITDTVERSATRLELLEQFVRLQSERTREETARVNNTLVDHEGRLRTLERTEAQRPSIRVPN